VQDLLDKFIAPGLVHKINHLRLTLYPNVALEAYEDRPVVWGNIISHRFAHVEEWNALAEGMPMSDDRSFGRRPHIDLNASRAMGQDVSVSGCGGMSKQLSSHEICVV